MSLLELFFPIATVVLAVGCYTCYRTGKPLRKKAAEEREAEAKKKAAEEREGREKDRRNNFRKELYSDLEQIIATPNDLIDHRYGSPSRGTGYRWKHLAEFILSVKAMKDQTETIRFLNEKLMKQSTMIRDLQIQQRDIVKALQLGQPTDY